MKLIKFKQTVCPSCEILETFITEELGVNADVTYNISEGGEALENAGKYGIMGTPVLLLIDEEGKEVDRVAGVNPGRITEIFSKRGLI